MNDSRTCELWNWNLCCLLFFEEHPKYLKMELVNLECDTNLNQVISEAEFQDFYSCLPKEKFLVLRYCGSRMIVILCSTHI